jgi:eukaryotic-like serine/threonine-protein kinase
MESLVVPLSESTDLTNKTIAGFRVLHRLGVGGMSEVYLAFQESLHRHVALKVLRADFVGSEDHKKRFLQEARAVASLMHPNIVQVYDVGNFGATHYIAQEYVPGSNLQSYVDKKGALPLAEALSILWQATNGLQKAASIGLVHRDIKPDNLLLTPDGEVKIADFGLARSNEQSQNLTAVGVTLGTPLYMSPEQIQGQEVDSRSDLYSLGATAYYMLSGRPPFSGDSALALAMQHVQATPPMLNELRPDLPIGLVNLIHKLLEKAPENRFASALELSRALRVVLDESLGSSLDRMVPFTGMVIEHQRIGNSAITQQLQQLTKLGHVQSDIASRVGKWFVACAAFLGLAIGSYWMVSSSSRVDTQALPPSAIVEKQPSVERQYALALIKNDLKHFYAVREYFPPNDPISRNYHLKSELQIARKGIEGEKFELAMQALKNVLESGYPNTDNVLLTIAHIELGWVMKKLQIPESTKHFDSASRDLSTMDSDRKNLILSALPSTVKLEWDQLELSKTPEQGSSS